MLCSCTFDSFSFGGDDPEDGGGIEDASDGDGGDGSTVDDAGFDAPIDACVPFPELCDGVDNNCDGTADEIFDLTRDAENCGGCGNLCYQPNTLGSCSDSVCSYVCRPGYVDSDNDASNGCDYPCVPTGDEVCDLSDNDCDRGTDEGIDLSSDVMNCSGCGLRCVALNADPICNTGSCTYGQCDALGENCVIGECDPGFADISSQVPGCEYQCPVPVTAETCDGIDEDCNGIPDDGAIAGVGGACADPGYEDKMGIGQCAPGTFACRFGAFVCDDFVRPTSEVCNTLDDDCNGAVDETFDFETDARNCGSCTPCDLPNAIEGCANSECFIVDCMPGFFDAFNGAADGCEYQCTPTGPETCDGVDNDCDGLIDSDDGDLEAPIGYCEDRGACANTAATCEFDGCSMRVQWVCNYDPATVELDLCGQPELQEATCDDIDGDCDGFIDESYQLKDTACADGDLGICRGEGVLVCDGSGSALMCDVDPSSKEPPEPSESCDGEDDDCDGNVDELAPDDMVAGFNAVTGTTFYIYTYEASRPDASDAGFGEMNHRSCSNPNVFPWRNVTHVEAAAACAAAGKRLCTEDEWQAGCDGNSGNAYPYGDGYDPDACNGRDVDLDCTGGDSDEVGLTAGTFTCSPPADNLCLSPDGAFDMSGNLKEWTDTPVGASFRVRGGAYDNIDEGLTCQLSFIAFNPSIAFPNLGFRCCADQPDL
jgi:hypothetical protein